MEILIRGQKYNSKFHKEIFKCANCFTVFSAYEPEYNQADSMWSVPSARCPNCLGMAFLHNLDTHEKELIESEFRKID